MDQTGRDHANQRFWHELCGTGMATELGITGNGPDDLSRFDAYFFRTYPYLQPFLGRAPVAGRRVLEIGLGYGTVGQRLAEQGARYTGMDIAAGPVAMMRHRLDLAELSGDAVQASALDLPFPSESLEVVVAIGCLHHTGDFPRAIREVHRVLVPGGHALVMVYNRFSYDQWLHWPLRTLRAWRRDRGWEAPEVEPSSEAQRRQYDFNRSGEAAPVTDFFSVTQAQEIFRDFSALHWQRENCHSPLWVPKIRHHVRRWMLPFMGGLGLDLYIHATK